MAKHGPGGHGYQKPKDIKKTLTFLLKYVNKYKFLLLVVLICMFLSSFAMIAGSYFLKPIINDYIIPGDFNGLARMLMLLGAIYLVGAGGSYAYARIMVYISQNAVAEMRRDLFHKMQDLPLRYFDTHSHGDLMSRYTNDIDTISEAINNSLAGVISNIILFFGVIVMMIVLSPILTLLTGVMIALILFTAQLIGKKSTYYFSLHQKKLGAVNGYIEEMMEFYKVLMNY